MSLGSALLGRTLGGRFRVTGFIGEGAMAAVYRGAQDAEPRDVAIKVMHPHLLNDPTFVGRFRREAKAAQQIRHPNTAQVIDTGIDDRILYIVMELLSGQDLFELLVLEKRLAEARAARLFLQICDALAAAHDKGIVHRDLKPENVMVIRDETNDRETVKVLDFGIAKILEREMTISSEQPISSAMQPSVLTTVGMVVGTPAYMSPEQCRGESIDARSDLYSAGILLYQLLTGRVPFSSPNAMDLAMLHVREAPPLPSSIVPKIHPGLEGIIVKALSKWPGLRHDNARAMRDDIARLLPELADHPLDVAASPKLVPIGRDGVSSTPATPRDVPGIESIDESRLPTVVAPRKEDPSKTAAVTTLVSQPALDLEPENDPAAETISAPLPQREPEDSGRAATLRKPAREPPAEEPPAKRASEEVTGPRRVDAVRAPAAIAKVTESKIARARKRKKAPKQSALLVAIAVLVGVAAGVVAFLVMR